HRLELLATRLFDFLCRLFSFNCPVALRLAGFQEEILHFHPRRLHAIHKDAQILPERLCLAYLFLQGLEGKRVRGLWMPSGLFRNSHGVLHMRGRLSRRGVSFPRETRHSIYSHVEFTESSGVLSQVRRRSSWREMRCFNHPASLSGWRGRVRSLRRGLRGGAFLVPRDHLPLLLPILGWELDSPDILRFQQFNADFEGVLSKALLTNPFDPSLGAPAQQWILD